MRFASKLAKGEQLAFDKTLLLALRLTDDLARPIGPGWLQTAMLDITALGSSTVLTLIVALAVSYLLAIRRRLLAAIVVASVAGGVVLNALLKISFARPRPEIVVPLVNESSMSFPSGHAANSATIYLTLAILLASTRTQPHVRHVIIAGALLVTMLVGVSRIYLGVHWPSDVVAGWAVGASWSLFCWFLTTRLRR